MGRKKRLTWKMRLNDKSKTSLGRKGGYWGGGVSGRGKGSEKLMITWGGLQEIVVQKKMVNGRFSGEEGKFKWSFCAKTLGWGQKNQKGGGNKPEGTEVNLEAKGKRVENLGTEGKCSPVPSYCFNVKKKGAADEVICKKKKRKKRLQPCVCPPRRSRECWH